MKQTIQNNTNPCWYGSVFIGKARSSKIIQQRLRKSITFIGVTSIDKENGEIFYVKRPYETHKRTRQVMKQANVHT